MNRSKILILTVFILLSFCYCGNKGSNSQSLEIKTALDNPNNMLIDNIIDSIWYIKLETTENALINFGGNELAVGDSSIFILSNNSIFLFDKNGTFINKSCKYGQGPKDIGYINKITWNQSKKELYALDVMNAKILIYDTHLEYKSHIPFNKSCGELISCCDDIYIGTMRDDFKKYGTKYAVNHINLKTGQISPLIKTRISPISPNAPSMFSFGTFLYHHNGQVYMKEYRSDSVFRITYGKKIEFAYHLNIGDIKPADLDYPGNEEQRKKSKQYITVNRIFETNRYIFVQAGYGNERNLLMYSKKNKDITLLNHKNTNLYDGGVPINNLKQCSDNLYFVNEIWPETFLNDDFKKRGLPNSIESKSAQNGLTNIIQRTKEDDNPILMFVKLKSDYE